MKKSREIPENLAQLTVQVKEYVEELIFSGDGWEQDRQEVKKKKNMQKGRLRQALHRCCLGSEGDRLFVKEFIKEVIAEQLGLVQDDIFRLFPVRREQELNAQDQFEILLYSCLRRYGAGGLFHLCRKYRLPREPSNSCGQKGGNACGGYEISGEELFQMVRAERVDIAYPDLLELLAQRVYQELYGFSFCDRLISQELAVDGVCAGQGAVYVMLGGKKIRLSFLAFESENELARVVRKLSRNHPRAQLSRRNCAMVLSLQNDARVTLARPPAAEGWNFYVRKFNTVSARELGELLTDENAVLAVSLLRMLVKGCMNLVVTGEQASGKTTLLKALVRFIDGKYSIRLAEGAFEMHLAQLYPERNIFSMQEHGEMQMREILALFKKTDTDVTICGEINEPQAAEAFVQIAQSGGRFTMCTSHHNTTKRLVSYMRNALLKEAGFGNERTATDQVVEALHFDVHLEQDKNGHRYIERITEIEREDENGYRLKEILVFAGGAYRLAGRIGEEHRQRICRFYPEWREEAAAAVLAEQGGRCIKE
ncbi:MAG: Flp pilus assembly complex ATPase component TadA [Lachnospiraceae bacterium]|nr:Flp pilus assembly complex ATPase component TadA [Lachnospiraceae bacterium]